jgi:predicted nucleotidyltransferase
VFGSVLRPDYRPGESDIDLLVEFHPLDPASLYKAYFALLNDLLRGLLRTSI